MVVAMVESFEETDLGRKMKRKIEKKNWIESRKMEIKRCRIAGCFEKLIRGR